MNAYDEIKKINTNKSSEHLFSKRNGEPYTADGFRSIWQRFMKGLVDKQILSEKERFRFHDIRRKTASDLEQVFGREAARQLLGHTNQKTTGIYISGVRRVKPLSMTN